MFESGYMLVATLCLSVLTFVLLTSSHSAETTFFRCPGDFELQVNQEAVRCYKTAKVQHQLPRPCEKQEIPEFDFPLNQHFETDYDGLADRCVARITVGNKHYLAVNHPLCAEGYVLDIRAGTDHCRKVIPESIEAPTIKITQEETRPY